MKRFSPFYCSAAVCGMVMTVLPTAMAWAESSPHMEEQGHESGGLPQLDPQSYSSQIFWFVLCFAILYFFLAYRILPQMTEIIEKRENLITGDLERAASLKEEADKTKIAYEQALSKAENHAASFMSETLQQLASDMNEQTQAAMHTIHTSLEKATTKLEKEKESAIQEIEHSIKDFADEIVDTLLKPREPKTASSKSKG